MEYISKLAEDYGISQWAIIVGPVLILLMIVFIIVLFIKILEPKYKLYKQDIFHGMLWKWKYKGEDIIDLWCYCPTCKSMLHVDDENCRATKNLGDKRTFFICDTCNESEIGKIIGGDRKYSLTVIKREILAKIRLNTFDIYAHKENISRGV